MEPNLDANLLESIVVGAVALTTRALTEAAPGVELTFPQWRAILVLGASATGARVGSVAARLGVTTPATGRLLRRLERRGLLALTTDQADHRATLAYLTTRGEEVRAAILAYRRKALDEVALEMATGGVAVNDPAIGALAAGLNRFA